MDFIQPKPYIEKLRTHNRPIGTVARERALYRILEKGTPLPLPIEFEDIDTAMFNWVDKVIDLAYDGKRLPTYKLYSSQRISEYAQTWQNLDESGGVLLNFKTITRDMNPQKGELNGGFFNIPGHRPISIFYVPILQENGTEAYDRYTVQQPFQVNFEYSVGIITNKIELLNRMNEKMHYEFNAIYTYISPNGHPMPISLDSISDESEYGTEDRKYYSQIYKIKVKGYIIRKEDMSVERIPSRIHFANEGLSYLMRKRKKDKSAKNRGRKERKTEFFDFNWRGNNDFFHSLNEDCEPTVMNGKISSDFENDIEMIEDYDPCNCIIEDNPKYAYRGVRINVNFDDCTSSLSFVSDREIAIDGIETTNIKSFDIIVNGEVASLDELTLYPDDEVEVRVVRDNLYKGGQVVIDGHDMNDTIDLEFVPETTLDEDRIATDVYVVGEDSDTEEIAP